MNEPFNPDHPIGEVEAPPPRRSKHKKGGHGGAWKVAYADFVTALLALFIVLWVMGQDDKVKEAVSAYFRDPAGYMKSGGAPFTIGKGATLSQTEGQVKEALEKALEKKLEEDIARMREVLEASDVLKQISDQVIFELTDEGIRMEFRDAPKFSFFKVGSAQVSPELDEIFRILTPEIAKLQYPVAIEGHTDQRPYGMKEYGNWELSADRGNAIRRVMLKYGMAPERVSEIRAYADTRLLKPSDPYAVENRRVSILLKSPLISIGTGGRLDK